MGAPKGKVVKVKLFRKWQAVSLRIKHLFANCNLHYNILKGKFCVDASSYNSPKVQKYLNHCKILYNNVNTSITIL